MKLFSALLLTFCAAQDIPKGIEEKADKYCNEYYTKKGVAEDTIELKLLGSGAQGAVYRCRTTSTNDVSPDTTALKVYFNTADTPVEKLKKIDEQLTEQNLRYPVYEWVEAGDAKFEEFLSGRRDTEIDDLKKPEVQEAVARQMARLHHGVVNGIDKSEYRKKKEGWWNTYQVKSHFEVMFDAMNYRIFPGKVKDVYKRTKMDADSLDREISWVQKTLQDYYGENEDAVVMCHNDLHNGNIMINNEGDFDPAKLVFIDYDNAGYGYRAWEILYHMLSWAWDVQDKEFVDFVNAYIDEYNKNNTGTKLTQETLYNEVQAHLPYVYLERIVFSVAFGFGSQEYVDIFMDLYIKEAERRGHTVELNSALHKSFSVLTIMLAYLAL